MRPAGAVPLPHRSGELRAGQLYLSTRPYRAHPQHFRMPGRPVTVEPSNLPADYAPATVTVLYRAQNVVLMPSLTAVPAAPAETAVLRSLVSRKKTIRGMVVCAAAPALWILQFNVSTGPSWAHSCCWLHLLPAPLPAYGGGDRPAHRWSAHGPSAGTRRA